MNMFKILFSALLLTFVSAYAYAGDAASSKPAQKDDSTALETIFIPLPEVENRDGNYHQQIMDQCDIRYQITEITAGYGEGYICVKKKS